MEMKVIYLLLFSIILRACVMCSRNTLSPRISGGKHVDIIKYPYQATLLNNGKPYCGATIIAEQWLITAGHCLKGRNIANLKARTGATKRYDDGEVHEIEEAIVHPDLVKNYKTTSNDVGLVKITKPIIFSNKQKPIRLAEPTDEYPPGTIMIISGFGLEKFRSKNKTLHLKATSIPVVKLTKCQESYYLDPITDLMMCAGTNGDSSCKGDSGGPAVAHGKLAGIISSGFRCNTTSLPAVFAAVNKYREWISKYVKADRTFQVVSSGGPPDVTP